MQPLLLLLSTKLFFIDFWFFFLFSLAHLLNVGRISFWRLISDERCCRVIAKLTQVRRVVGYQRLSTASRFWFSLFTIYFRKPDTPKTFLRVDISTANEKISLENLLLTADKESRSVGRLSSLSLSRANTCFANAHNAPTAEEFGTGKCVHAPSGRDNSNKHSANLYFLLCMQKQPPNTSSRNIFLCRMWSHHYRIASDERDSVRLSCFSFCCSAPLPPSIVCWPCLPLLLTLIIRFRYIFVFNTTLRHHRQHLRSDRFRGAHFTVAHVDGTFYWISHPFNFRFNESGGSAYNMKGNQRKRHSRHEPVWRKNRSKGISAISVERDVDSCRRQFSTLSTKSALDSALSPHKKAFPFDILFN